MEVLWDGGAQSIREVTDRLRGNGTGARPAYSTVQTMVYRLEARGAIRRVEKIRNFHVFEASVSRESAESQMVQDFVHFFDGRVWPILEHSIRMGMLKLAEVKDAERFLQDMARWQR